ncbi:hypothetical protein PC121_g8692 [Phytophthora cactorum]|nr:hypothetical protein PC120_g14088 [Phytophthora cactorum]KAG3073442.1 hypothetical protein PC121_g8692 [Phytophthora cactorum]KAG4047170.1 hypothetical protein PC123_g17462 [Phytophthora cactorum]
MRTYITLLVLVAALFASHIAVSTALTSHQMAATAKQREAFRPIEANPRRLLRSHKVKSDTAANAVEGGITATEERGMPTFVKDFLKKRQIKQLVSKKKTNKEIFDKGIQSHDVWFALNIPKLQKKLQLDQLVKHPKFIAWLSYDEYVAGKI